MKTRTFGFLIMMTLLLAVGSTQTDRSVRLAFLPYGDCATCFSLHLTRETVHLYTLLTVTPDGQRLYLIDTGGVLHVLSRTGEHLRSVRKFAVPSRTIQAIAPDGSMVALDSSMPIEVRAESHAADQPEAYRTESRCFWILKPDGTIDWERSDKFYQALDNLLDFIVEKYGKANPTCHWVFFYTGDRLGYGLRSLATQTDEGTYELVHPAGLVILKQDGGFERIIYDGAIAASKQGAILQDPAKGEEAQKEQVRRRAAGDSNLVYIVDYRILEEDGTIIKGSRPAFEPVPRRVRLISPDGKQSKEIVLRQDLMGTLLDDWDYRLDGRGRLYCAGSLPEQRVHTLWIAGQEKGLALLDGPIVVRFREDGQYDGVVAQLKLPADISSLPLPWDVDNAGNLYYLHFTTEGVEVRMIPSK